jgi:hypothetical protein
MLPITAPASPLLQGVCELDHPGLDIKADVHTIRVLFRLGVARPRHAAGGTRPFARPPGLGTGGETRRELLRKGPT